MAGRVQVATVRRPGFSIRSGIASCFSTSAVAARAHPVRANDMVILGGPERVADTILRLASRLDLMGLAMIFKLGVMPYDMVERSMSLIGEEVVPRIRQVLTRGVSVDRTAAEPSSSIQGAVSHSPPASCPAVGWQSPAPNKYSRSHGTR
jgi:hypothetical protein